MNITEYVTVGQIVAKDYRTATLFSKYGIDYCCGGQKTIKEVCDKKQVNTAALMKEIIECTSVQETGTSDYSSWDPDLLVDHIVKKHHRYVRKRIPELMPLLEKLTRVHGNKYAYLAEVKYCFLALSEELLQHMADEETLLFPMITHSNNGISPAERENFKKLIGQMEGEHEQAGDAMRRISELTDGYTPPPAACTTHRVTYAILKEFEEDLHLHVHLENNILFTKLLA
ncbi:iron-sulfur cluster repair di-iron protein [Robertkochia aurantiaca]|uniref:iron-sulfur cluster repair di-iron protein n=1 Tax=Robertkochia aurantiaca TaxID=2873700 RepID=UPI001CCC7662|nr:iron-sulfur cluster repair di-iron protein [Robertkochia sp. 3YJGBD-33]